MIGLSVVELRGCLGAAWAGRILADAGAEVVSLDSGSLAWLEDAIPKWRSDGGSSRHLDRGKVIRHVESNTTGLFESALRDSLVGAEYVLRCSCWASLTPAIDVRWLLANTSATVVSVTPFGLQPDYTDPCPDFNIADALVQAACGWSAMVGDPDLPPVPVAGEQTQYLAGAYAAMCAVSTALLPQQSSPRVIDVAGVDTGLSVQQGTISRYSYTGAVASRPGNRNSPAPSSIFPCTDGWVCLAAPTVEQWRTLTGIIGMPELLEDERFADGVHRTANADYLEAVIGGWTSERTIEEVVGLCQSARVPAVPVQSTGDLLRDPQCIQRRFHDSRGTMELPFLMDDRRLSEPLVPALTGETPQ